MGALHTPEFWVAIGFLILMALLIRPGLKAATAALDGRAERIRSNLDDARALYEEAQHVLAEYQRKQRDAARDVDDIVAHARIEAGRLAKEAEEKLADAIARREQQATDKITQAEADAIVAVRNAAVDIAIAATRRILTDKMDEREQAALIDQAIGELSIHLH
jgi:F-type H+-transporting ATPase subunit b